MSIGDGRYEPMKLNLQFFAEPGEGDQGAGGDNPGGSDQNVGTGADGSGNGGESKETQSADLAALNAQLEQMKLDMAKQKAALDAATSEAGKYRKELQARKTQEEIDADNKKEAEEKTAKELAELRKEVAKAKSTKSVMAKLGVDENAAGKIAESLIGCENVDNALLLIQQAWTAREKALRLEFGKIPGPGAGGSSEEDAEEKAAIERAKQMGRERANAGKSVIDGLKGYIR